MGPLDGPCIQKVWKSLDYSTSLWTQLPLEGGMSSCYMISKSTRTTSRVTAMLSCTNWNRHMPSTVTHFNLKPRAFERSPLNSHKHCCQMLLPLSPTSFNEKTFECLWIMTEILAWCCKASEYFNILLLKVSLKRVLKVSCYTISCFPFLLCVM